MAPEPDTAAETPGEDVADTWAPDAASGPAPAADTDTLTEADTGTDALTATVRRAAADALEHLAEALDDDTSITSLFAAIKDQADAAGRAHGLKPGSWNHDRVEAVAIVALYTATLTHGEAAYALHKRLRKLGTNQVASQLTNAITILRP